MIVRSIYIFYIVLQAPIYVLPDTVFYRNQSSCANFGNSNGDHRILIRGHWTEVGTFCILAPATPPPWPASFAKRPLPLKPHRPFRLGQPHRPERTRSVSLRRRRPRASPALPQRRRPPSRPPPPPSTSSSSTAALVARPWRPASNSNSAAAQQP